MEIIIMGSMGGCQNYGPFVDPCYNTAPNMQDTPKTDHNFDNHPYVVPSLGLLWFSGKGLHLKETTNAIWVYLR